MVEFDDEEWTVSIMRVFLSERLRLRIKTIDQFHRSGINFLDEVIAYE